MTPLAALLAEVRGQIEAIKNGLLIASHASFTAGEQSYKCMDVAIGQLTHLLALAEPTGRAEDGSELQRAVEAEREACARIMCYRCRRGEVPFLKRMWSESDPLEWYHVMTTELDGAFYGEPPGHCLDKCGANAIRQRAAAPTEGRPSPPPDAQDRAMARAEQAIRALWNDAHYTVEEAPRCADAAACNTHLSCIAYSALAALAQAEAKYQGQLAATERVRETAGRWQRAYQDECDTSTKLRAELAALAQARGAGEG